MLRHFVQIRVFLFHFSSSFSSIQQNQWQFIFDPKIVRNFVQNRYFSYYVSIIFGSMEKKIERPKRSVITWLMSSLAGVHLDCRTPNESSWDSRSFQSRSKTARKPFQNTCTTTERHIKIQAAQSPPGDLWPASQTPGPNSVFRPSNARPIKFRTAR